MSKSVYVKNVSKSNELCDIMDKNMIIYIDEFLKRLNNYLKGNNHSERILNNDDINKYKIKYINKIIEYKTQKKIKEKKDKENAALRYNKVKENLIKSKEHQQKISEQILINDKTKL